MLDKSDLCYVANMGLILGGTALTLTAVAMGLGWPWWAVALAFVPVFIAWHLAVERCLSRYVNRLIEGPAPPPRRE
jgi:hypothetical protein